MSGDEGGEGKRLTRRGPKNREKQTKSTQRAWEEPRAGQRGMEWRKNNGGGKGTRAAKAEGGKGRELRMQRRA